MFCVEHTLADEEEQQHQGRVLARGVHATDRSDTKPVPSSRDTQPTDKVVGQCEVCQQDFVSGLCTVHNDGRRKKRCDSCEDARQAGKAMQRDLQRAVAGEAMYVISATEQLLQWRTDAFNDGQMDIAACVQELKACLADNTVYANISQVSYLGHEGDWQALQLTRMEVEAAVAASQWTTDEELQLQGLEVRALHERVTPLLRPEVMAQRPYQFSPRDTKSLMDLCENARRCVVEFGTMKEPEGGWRENQLKLRAIKTPEDAKRVIEERKLQVYASLSDTYQAVRVSNIRMWCEVVVQIEKQSPWRMHWPESHGDDEIMTGYLMIMSMRNTSYAVVEHAKMHIIEFHLGYLGRSPPPFPIADWHLKKLKLAMAKEKPTGRKVRPGLSPEQVEEICAKLLSTLMIPASQLTGQYSSRQRLYANAGAAISFIYEKALRAGEACPGEGYKPAVHLSRSTIAGALIPREQMQSRGEALIVQPPVRKTTYTSMVAAQLTNQPLVFDTRSEQSYSFCRWAPLLEQYDPCKISERETTPAFRIGGMGSEALSTANIRSILSLVAQSVVPNWHLYHYGAHTLRISKENAWRGTVGLPGGASSEFVSMMTTHTSEQGRAPYSRLQVQEILNVDRAAANVKLAAVETAYKFDEDRSTARPAVYMSRDGTDTFQQTLVAESSEEDEMMDFPLLSEHSAIEHELKGGEAAGDAVGQKRAADEGAADSAAAPHKKPRGRAPAGMLWDGTQGRWMMIGQPSIQTWIHK